MLRHEGPYVSVSSRARLRVVARRWQPVLAGASCGPLDSVAGGAATADVVAENGSELFLCTHLDDARGDVRIAVDWSLVEHELDKHGITDPSTKIGALATVGDS
jgi:hypothetical protein